MGQYDLTDSQKGLLRTFVKLDEEGRLVEKGMLLFIHGDDVYTLWGGDKLILESLSDVETLCDANLLAREPRRGDNWYRILNAAGNAVRDNFKLPSAPVSSQVSIGAIISQMSGGNLQAIGRAENSEISQVINDPAALRLALEDWNKQLLSQVKDALGERDYDAYCAAAEALKQQALEQQPDPLLSKRLIQTLGFFGAINGTISLMERVWPFIQLSLMVIAAKLTHPPI